MCVCVFTCLYVCIYMYTHIQKDRQTDRQTNSQLGLLRVRGLAFWVEAGAQGSGLVWKV